MLRNVLVSRSIQYFFSVIVSVNPFGLTNFRYILTSFELPSERFSILLSFFGSFNSCVALSFEFILQQSNTVLSIPYTSILCPTHSISDFKKFGFVFAQSIPFVSSFVNTSISSRLCCSFVPLVTTNMSSNHSGCLFSSVWSIFSWNMVGMSAKP